MKNKQNYLLLALGFMLVLACTKSVNEFDNESLETRGNDNHRNWKLSRLHGDWNYNLSDGSTGVGSSDLNYTYGCNRPYGRAISSTDVAEEDGNGLWEINRTMTYTDNFMVDEEITTERLSGSVTTRKFLYDTQGKWIGITTTVDGVVLDDEIEIGPAGRVLSYTHDGVRNTYIWRGDNISKVKTYIMPTEELTSLQKSNSFTMVGINDLSRKRIKETVLTAYKKIKSSSHTALRNKSNSDWVLVQVEEQTVDRNIIQPFSGPSKGYPGSVGDGGYLILPKNFIVYFKIYAVNPDGTEGDLIFLQNTHTISVRDNLPDKISYNLEIPHIFEDENGNPVDWHESGNFDYDYISGCTESVLLKLK